MAVLDLSSLTQRLETFHTIDAAGLRRTGNPDAIALADAADVNRTNRLEGPELRRFVSDLAALDGAAGATLDTQSGRAGAVFSLLGLYTMQTTGQDGPLGRQLLSAVPALAEVAAGRAVLKRLDGARSVGTGSLQDALNEIAAGQMGAGDRYEVDLGPNAQNRGFFGARTQAAVENFQRAHGLFPSGVVDQGTLVKLDEELKGVRAPTIVAPPASPVAPTLPPLATLTYNDRFGRSVALTFDDGPNPAVTPRILDILKHNNVKATFFVLGQNVRKYPALVRRIVAEGHALGNHSFDHPDLRKLTAAEVESQLDRTKAEIEAALGAPYALTQMRPPYGATNATVRGVLQERGYSEILWTVDPEDWKRNPTQTIANIFDGASKVQPAKGGPLVCHDIHATTADALQQIIDGLTQRGYACKSIDELLALKYPAATV